MVSQSPSSPAPVLLHAHLFKNAGSTLDWSLRRNFGEGFLDHRDDALLRDNPGALAALLSENPGLRALSSHWLPRPLTREVAERALLLVLLRNPVDRARSVYDFERAQTGATGPSATQAKRLGFRDFIAWRLEAGRGPVIRNYQARYLSGDFRARDPDALLPRAKAQLEAACFGIVERYDESMALFEKTLENGCPGIDLAAPPQNVSRGEDSSLAQRLAEIEDELGPVHERLLAEHRLDLALYEWAMAEFERRLSAVDDRVDRLADVRARTRRLR